MRKEQLLQVAEKIREAMRWLIWKVFCLLVVCIA